MTTNKGKPTFHLKPSIPTCITKQTLIDSKLTNSNLQ